MDVTARCRRRGQEDRPGTSAHLVLDISFELVELPVQAFPFFAHCPVVHFMSNLHFLLELLLASFNLDHDSFKFSLTHEQTLVECCLREDYFCQVPGECFCLVPVQTCTSQRSQLEMHWQCHDVNFTETLNLSVY